VFNLTRKYALIDGREWLTGVQANTEASVLRV
jgi:hypothetical protein